jgi:hypothetical protein
MKLREFLDYKKECPICQNPLNIAFHSNRRQKIRFEDNRMLILFPLDGLTKKQKHYKVGYSFGFDDNSLRIEFFTHDEIRYEDVSPRFLMDRFKSLDENLAGYKIYKHCNSCERYNYATNPLNFDYKNCSIGELSVHTEQCWLIKPAMLGGYKVYSMVTYYKSKETFINYGKVKSLRENKYITDELTNHLHTGLIPFTSHDETLKRLEKLILFS